MNTGFSMNRISVTLDTLGTDLEFDAIVIGSGYGGSVAALRLSEVEGLRVCLLERGQEILPGSYPTTLTEAAGQLRLVTAEAGLIVPPGRDDGTAPPVPNGMMELRLGKDMHVILGNGLGGGSLINANVAIRPDPWVFGKAWPSIYRDPKTLDAAFAKASAMLRATPLPDAIKPPKLAALEVSAAAIKQPIVRPPLAINFTPGAPLPGGGSQPACTYCGDCCAGCNYGAKNTLIMNYLPQAHLNQAILVTQAEVDTVTPVSGGGWQVAVNDLSKPASAKPVGPTLLTAKTIVLAAGALGSTEILARSAAAGLPVVAANLGKRFSGNGDILGFGHDANVNHWLPPADPNAPAAAAGPGTVPVVPLQPNLSQLPELYSIGAGANPATGVPGQGNPFAPGPTITGMVRVNMKPGDPLGKALVIEDGVAPGALALVYPAAFVMEGAISGNMLEYPDLQRRLLDMQSLGGQIMSEGPTAALSYTAPMTRMQSYLVMSHDAADGVLAFSATTRMVSVDWPNAGRLPPYPTDNDWLRAMAEGIWANYLPNPLWQKDMGGQLVSVHPLGGLVMAESAADGMVDPDCRLYTGKGQGVHDSFLVCDGSVLPAALGINPFLTITAVAERAMAQFIAAHGWKVAGAKPPAPAPGALPPSPSPTPARVTLAGKVGALLAAEVPTIVMVEALLGACKFVTVEGENFQKTTADILALTTLLDVVIQKALPQSDWEQARVAVTAAMITCSAADVRSACTALAGDLKALLQSITPGDPEQAQWAALFDAAEALLGPVEPTLSFSETMRGAMGPLTEPSAQILSSGYELSAAMGRKKGVSVVADFSVVADNGLNLSRMPNGLENGLVASLYGKVTVGSNQPVPIEDGTFTLFKPDGEKVETWMMVYTGKLGSQYQFTGRKYLARPDQTGQSWFQDLTTLYIDLVPLSSANQPQQGVLKLGIQDMAPQVVGTQAKFSAADATGAFLYVVDQLGQGKLTEAVTSRAVLNRVALAAVGVAAQSASPVLKAAAKDLAIRYEAAVAQFFAKLVFRTNGGLLSYLYDFPAQDAAPSAIPTAASQWQIATTVNEVAKSWTAQRYLLSPDGTAQTDPDSAPIVLYRYNGNPGGVPKGPVVLSPGFGTTVLSFACLTNTTKGATDNVVIQLLNAGYDVWLYDNRSRPRQASYDKTTQGKTVPKVPPFTLDMIAQEDWPAAVDFILQTTGAKDVQILAHCVGAMSAQMAILHGGLEGKVRNLVASQLTVQPVTNWFNLAKGDLNLAGALADGQLQPLAQRLAAAGFPIPPEIVGLLGKLSQVDAVTPPAGFAEMTDNVINLLAWYAPFGADHPCESPTCHRIFGIFGPSYLHENLNEATHDGIRDFFGVVSVSSFEQIGLIVAKGQAVDATGQDVYMPHVRRLALPIHFIAGAKNLEFLPDTSLKTLRWLKTELRDKAALFTRTLYPGYGHMDFFIGKHAGTDIFPDLVAELDKYPRKA